MTGDQRSGVGILGTARPGDAFLADRDELGVDRVVVRRDLDVVPDAPVDGGALGGQR